MNDDHTAGDSTTPQQRQPGRPRMTRPTETLTAKIFRDDYDRLSAMAQRNRTTLSALVRGLAARRWRG